MEGGEAIWCGACMCLFSLQDVIENGADVSHFNYVHTQGIVSGSGADYKNLFLGKLQSHDTSVVKWEPLSAPSSHMARTTLKIDNLFFGINVLTVNATLDQVRVHREGFHAAFVIQLNSNTINILIQGPCPDYIRRRYLY